MIRGWRHVAALVLIALAAGCSKESGQAANSSGRMTIAVIPKGTTHAFWQSVHAGANKAAQELGVDIIWRGPLREDDRDAQITEVEASSAAACPASCSRRSTRRRWWAR